MTNSNKEVPSKEISDMPEFDFSKVQAKKSAKVPSITRHTTKVKVNPLLKEYEKSLATKNAAGLGEWQHLILPGKAEREEVINTDGEKTEKVTFGPVVKKAMAYLRQAAVSKEMGISFRTEDNGDGNVTLHFQAKPRRGTVV